MFVLRKICNTDAKEIHIFFYNRENPSPKDVETQKQMQLFDNGQKYQIKGENQQRNQNLQACLSNSSFRTELIKFVIEFWQQNNATSEILDDKRVFLSFGEKCYLYSNQHQKGLILHTFENNHFEIESKMIFHMYKMKSKNIRVMTANPDSVIVHLLYHMQYWVQDRVVEIEYGDPKKNTLQRISVRDIFNDTNSYQCIASMEHFHGLFLRTWILRKRKNNVLEKICKKYSRSKCFREHWI